MTCDRAPDGNHDITLGAFSGERACRFCGRTPLGIAHSDLAVRVDLLGSALDDLRRAVEVLTAHVYSANCPHDSSSGVDDLPLDDPAKVWLCHSCGQTWTRSIAPASDQETQP